MKLRKSLLLAILVIPLAFLTGVVRAFAVSPNSGGKLVDFYVDVESGKNIKVLQLTDPQIVESEQQRSSRRLGATLYNLWLMEKKEENFKKYCRQVINKYNPDLIIITGDLVYGEFDDDGSAFLDFIEFMDSFEIPWAPVFGNHDNESYKGVDWQCSQLESSPYCLFEQRELTGNGNYTVGIRQDGILKRVFFMMDSNGYLQSAGFGSDQIAWYTQTAAAIKEASPGTTLSFAFHIQPYIFSVAMQKYGPPPVNIDEVGDEGEFGYMGKSIKTQWDSDFTVWNSLKGLGVDSIFVGHEHCNSLSILYEGVRLQYGQKSSVYDRANYLAPNGSISVGSYTPVGIPIIGGTAIDLSLNDGSIDDAYIIYYNDGETNQDTLPEVTGKIANRTEVLDANGTGFDVSVNTSGFSNYRTYSAINDSNLPSGYEGEIYKNSGEYLVAIGLKFDGNMLENNVTAIKVRVYVSSYTASQPPLFRIYNDSDNQILAEQNAADMGLIAGQWCEIDVLPLMKSAGRIKDYRFLDTVLVYRFYKTNGTAKFYIDSVKIEYAYNLYGKYPYEVMDGSIYLDCRSLEDVPEDSDFIISQYDSDNKLIAAALRKNNFNKSCISFELGESASYVKIFVWDIVSMRTQIEEEKIML